MNGEQLGQLEHEGERYLQLLGLGHLAGREIMTAEGTVIEARDFLKVCGEHSRPAFVAFEDMSPSNPDYETTRDVLRSVVLQYIGGDSPRQ